MSVINDIICLHTLLNPKSCLSLHSNNFSSKEKVYASRKTSSKTAGLCGFL